MSSEKRARKFSSDDVSLLRSGYCFWLLLTWLSKFSANQKHYPDLGSDSSSVWNFCSPPSDVISRGETTGGVVKGRLFSKGTIVDKSLGTLAFLERFAVHTCPAPPHTPQTTFYACIHNFSKFQLFLGYGKKYLPENPEKDALALYMREPRNCRKLWILYYCPKDFCPWF